MRGEHVKKGQVSMEYLVIVGVAIGLLVPAALFFYLYSQSSIGSTTSNRINEIGLEMVSTAKSTYALGTGAWQTMEIALPEGTNSYYIQRTHVSGPPDQYFYELIFSYETPYGPSQAVFFTSINISNASGTPGYISTTGAGTSRVKFTSIGNSINVTEMT